MSKKQLTILAGVFILGFLLRFWRLGEVPAGFNADEAVIGYDAYSIAETGRDQWGETLPLLKFISFGDEKLPVQIYLVAAAVKSFGLNEWSVRLPVALAGTFSILAVYWLASLLFKNFRIALLSALLLAVSPWHLFASRIAHEGGIAILFSCLTLVFLFKSQKQHYFFILAALFMGLGLLTYTGSTVFIFLLAALYFLLYRKNYKKRTIAIFFLPAILLITIFFTQTGSNRFRQISFTRTQGILINVDERQGECSRQGVNNTVCRFFYTKYIALGVDYIKNYINHFSFKLLFTEGGANVHYSLYGRGLMYLMEAPFFLIGIYFLIKNRGKEGSLLLFWLLFYPVASSFTGSDNPGRMLVVLPALQIVTAYGFIGFIKQVNPSLLKVAAGLMCGLLLIVSTVRYLFDYYITYPAFSVTVSQYGYKPLFQYLKTVENNYERIYISRRFDDAKQYIWYLFYNQYPPQSFQEKIDVDWRVDNNNWIQVNRIGKYYFVETIPGSYNSSDLLVGVKQEVPKIYKPIKIIDNLKGDPLYYIFDIPNE